MDKPASLTIALGEIKHILNFRQKFGLSSLLKITGFLLVIIATLLLFYGQTMKNGFLYALLCAIVFAGLILFEHSHKSVKQRLLLAGAGLLIAGLTQHASGKPNSSVRESA